MWKQWEALPPEMQNEAVRPYWESLQRKRGALRWKRGLDVVLSAAALAVLALPMAVIALAVRLTSPGPAFFRQERVTAFGKRFFIHKFRTMTQGPRAEGGQLTAAGDSRVTSLGAVLRRYKLDELPQLLDVLRGDMTLVGTRPEVPRYVAQYAPEYYATLLLPAGITSQASIRFVDEEQRLAAAEDPEACYLREILPEKMAINLRCVREFSLGREWQTALRTVAAIMKRRT